MRDDFPLVVEILLVITTLGIGALFTGAFMNLVARVTRPRDEDDWGGAGIDDKVVRRYGPPTLRIGAWMLLVTLPLLIVAMWMTD